MAYIVNSYNGTQLTVVEDGTIDQTTDLKFVGKNYSGYGEAQNENFLHLLEHFNNTTPPTKAITGQVWYDAGTTKLKFYTGTAWKNAGGAEVASSEPAGLNEGDLWWSTVTNQLYGKTGAGEFILVGPQAAGTGTTQMLSATVLDITDSEKNVIIALINDSPVYIISNTEFTLKAQQPENIPALTGFTLIKRGITLVNSETGLTENDLGNYISAAEGEPIIWGTANDALRLGGFLASDYRRVDQAINFDDVGFTLGDGNDLQVKIDTDGVSPVIWNVNGTAGDKLYLGARRPSAGASTKILSVRNTDAATTGLFPEIDNTYNIGNTNLKFAQIWATSFKGTADAANNMKIGATNYPATTAATANTIAARDASGNITAVEFNGTATKARYADLAEKYTTDKEYPVGTAIAVASSVFVDEKDISAECRAAKSSDIAIGVISAEPAYLMNSEAPGQAVGLKGRVPVRVQGPIRKGEPVYAWEDGVCTQTATRALVGIALENNSDPGEKLVECVLKT